MLKPIIKIQGNSVVVSGCLNEEIETVDYKLIEKEKPKMEQTIKQVTKSLTALQLLRLALKKEHIKNCPKGSSKLLATECICWQLEVLKWDIKTRAVSKARTRLGRPKQMHLKDCKCSTKKQILVTDVKEFVTCKVCKKNMNKS